MANIAADSALDALQALVDGYGMELNGDVVVPIAAVAAMLARLVPMLRQEGGLQ